MDSNPVAFIYKVKHIDTDTQQDLMERQADSVVMVNKPRDTQDYKPTSEANILRASRVHDADKTLMLNS